MFKRQKSAYLCIIMKHFQKIILSLLFAAITFLISANTNVFREQNPESKKVYAENVHKQQELHTVKPQVLFDGEISPEIVWARILTAQPTRSLQTSHLQTLQYLPFRTQKLLSAQYGMSTNGKQFETAAPFDCQPSCEYYVFALCRLLI